MECGICFETFFTPKTKEELKNYYKENVKEKSYNEIMKFENLLITTKHNSTHSCSTPNCNTLICSDCWIKITHKGNDLMEATEDEFPSIYDYFICPFCNQIDWKYYMNNVFNELQEKVLGQEQFLELYTEKLILNGFKL